MRVQPYAKSVELTVRLPYPPTTNHAYAIPKGMGRHVLTKAGRKFKESVVARLDKETGARALRALFRRYQPATLAVTLRVFPPDLRKRDLANTEKLLVDAVFRWLDVDDSRIARLLMERLEPDRPEGRVEITVEVTKWLTEPKAK